MDLDHFQSNAEYALIDRIHQAKDTVDYILINPARLRTPVLLSATHCCGEYPFIEIHLSNVHAREPFATIRICRISPLALSADWAQTVIHTLYRQRLKRLSQSH
ncbi:3-dehydroquinate dehydratase [Enterobacter cloacae]|uniref:3-dehydroquinate dehydratase n=1 Tax=Enterobacter cloacae TaxID=550 RepID=A0A377LRV7_ENTCL|nr:3-dehydroquinate dehydratase [Enterobacter cloacae]